MPLVGTGYRERKEGEEGKNESTHGVEEKKVENKMPPSASTGFGATMVTIH